MKQASRSQGTARAPAAHFVRFTEEQNDRLHGVARYLGTTIAGYLHDAAMKAIAEVEAERRAESEFRAKRNLRTTIEPMGLGLGDRFGKERIARETEPKARPAAAPPVVVQVQVPPTVPGSDGVEPVARYVVNGSKGSRDIRLREATTVLAGSTDNQEERERLARALDDQIALADRNSKKEPTDLSGLFERMKAGLFG